MNATELKTEIFSAIDAANDLGSLDTVRVTALGKNGQFTALMKTLGSMSPEERKEQGAALNVIKDEITARLEARQKILKKTAMAEKLKAETIDMTLEPRPQRKGTIHPITQTMDEMIAIFADMGFSCADGPDIEDDFHNFTALNFPPKHPAREMQDTFFLPDKAGKDGEAAKMVLRTHTSPCQIRAMMELGAPLRKIVMGRVYRNETVDMTHAPMFHQLEGLVIDETTHMGHLKGCLEEFCKAYFKTDTVPLRFRPSFFPFTEPSAEVDVKGQWVDGRLEINPNGKWIEILGCGMVHPNVLKNAGIDPDKYQGFAFGMGIERLVMLKYGIADLRQMTDGDVRWNAYYGRDALDIPNMVSGV